MPTYRHPGVYIEEIPSGSKPIEAVSTSTAAFVGRAIKGPVGEAVLIHSRDDYVSTFGNIDSDSDHMGLAVQAFFMNGGKDAYICRMASDDSPSAAASSTVNSEDENNTITIRATSIGEWGNDVYYRIIKPDQDALVFDMEIGHHEKGAFKKDETFSDLTMNTEDDNYLLTQVNDNSNYVKIVSAITASQYQQGLLTGGEMSDAADAFSSGMSGTMTMTLNINGLGAQQISLDVSSISLGGTNNNTDGGAVATEVQRLVRALGTQTAYASFTCNYSSGRFELQSGEAGSQSSVDVVDGAEGASNLTRFLKLDSNQKATFTGDDLASEANNYFSTSLTGTTTLALNIDDHGNQTLSIDTSQLLLEGDRQADGVRIATAVQNAVKTIDSNVAAYKDFKCQYVIDTSDSSERFVLTSGSSSSRNSSISIADGSSGGLADIMNLQSTDTVSESAGREIEHGTARIILENDLGTLDQGTALAGGGEAPAGALDYGDFYANVLRKVRDVSIMVLPGQYWAADGSGNPMISQTLAHCEAMKDRVLILDPPPDEELEQGAQVSSMGLPTSTYSVLYYPWVKVANPFYNVDTNPNAEKTLTIAPSAFAAGMWAKIDGKRGVWKAPAGVEAQLRGVAGLEFTVEDGEQDQLNPLGINCIRKLPNFGSVFWGSRTLATKADPEWRYVPVRRTAIFIERSIYGGIQWAVFEPNDEPLWSALRTNIDSFMNGLFRAAAFQGAKASDAYFVRCGLGDTMTQGDIDRGQVVVIVGFAPLKPAEFVIVRIQQKVGQ